MTKLIIGTRGSKLALWQANWVKDRLGRLRPELTLSVQAIKTQGDRRHDLAPEAFGREGIFTAELDHALADRRIDIAVHSLKDLPTQLAPGVALAAVAERESAADVFILRADLVSEEIRRAASIAFLDLTAQPLIVGTSSPRRIAQLKHRFPHLEFAPMRGNLDTRLRKLAEREVDALVVAQAGLNRLSISLQRHLAIPLSTDFVLPAAGQGALALETREHDPARELAALLDHAPTRAAVTAERTAMAALGAGCRVPAGFLAEVRDGKLRLQGVVAHPSGEPLIRAERTGESSEPGAVGQALAKDLLAHGARQVLAGVRG